MHSTSSCYSKNQNTSLLFLNMYQLSYIYLRQEACEQWQLLNEDYGIKIVNI